MSGPKHFRVARRPASAASIAHRAREEAERERRRQEELRHAEEERRIEQERLRKIAEAKAAAEAAERKRILNAQITEAVASCQVEIESSKPLLDRRFSIAAIEAEFAALKEAADAAKESASIQASADQLKQKLHDHIESVKRFRAVEAECVDCMKTLSAEKAVQAFSAAELGRIREAHRAVAAAGTLSKDGPVEAAEKLRQVIIASRALVTESLTKEANFDVRNKLLKTTINALQSLGFFVSDPEYSNPSDPLGNVVVTATRGAERVLLSVPLVGDVESDWQGVPEEPCKGDFFAFLDKLEAGGFPCTPIRPDLQERPKLIRKGEKQLPGSAGTSRTV